MIASDEIWPAGRFERRGQSARREMMSFSHAATNRPTQRICQGENEKNERRKERERERKNGDSRRRYLYIVFINILSITQITLFLSFFPPALKQPIAYIYM
jgi:hypothetical protein